MPRKIDLDALIHRLWAKADKKDNTYHPLLWHIIDTSCVADYFWRNILGERARERITKGLNLDEVSAAKWIPFLAGLHDIGKASEVFQSKSSVIFKSIVKAGIPQSAIKGENLHHTLFGTVVIPCLFSSENNNNFPQFIAQLLGGHHGAFPTSNEIFNAKNSVASWENGKECWDQFRRILYERLDGLWLNPNISVPMIEPFFHDNVATALFAGIVTVSDWIASNEEFFPYRMNITEITDYAETAKKQACCAFDKIHWGEDLFPDKTPSFESLFPYIKNDLLPVQRKINVLTDISSSPRLIVIEAPMGEGKTEAALLTQARLFKRNKQKGAYFALPTMATSNQMFQRVHEYLKNAFSEEYVNYHLLHSHALLSDEYSRIKTHSIDIDGKESEAGAVIADEWFCKSKRGLLASFAVGTVDQTLLSVLQTRHGFVRLFGLADKTIIFDEVHAYDVYMSTLFERLLDWLGRMGTNVIILSATLSHARLIGLLAAYSGKKPNLNQLTPYPRISWIDQNNGFHCETVEVSKDIELNVKWIDDDFDSIAMKLSDLLCDGGCAAWICNTVNRAQDVYVQLKERLNSKEIEIDLFHARYPFNERDKREKRALRKYGKNGDRPKRSILVATQVIEQSLDLDFDLMISEIAPIDLILQRSGRLHRHFRLRPHKLSDRVIYIIKPDDHDKNFPTFGHSVYEEWILLRTWLEITSIDKIKIPQDMENLIESVYGEDNMENQSDDMNSRLSGLKEKFFTKNWEKESNARTLVISKPDDENFMDKWNQELDEDNPDTHKTLQALTRDSPNPTVSIICIHDKEGKLYIDSECEHNVDLEQKPDYNQIKRLLTGEAKLSYRGCVAHFTPEMIPEKWRKTPILRHHRAVIFKNGRHEESGLSLHTELGIILPKQGEKK